MDSLLKDKRPVIYGNGEQKRDFIFVSDVVNALLRASTIKGFGIYNVGTGKNYSLNEAISKLQTITEKKIAPKYIEMPVKNYVMTTLADTTKSKREIGFDAKISLDEGISLLFSSVLSK